MITNFKSPFLTFPRVKGFVNNTILPLALIAFVMDIRANLRKEFGVRYNVLIFTAFCPDLTLLGQVVLPQGEFCDASP